MQVPLAEAQVKQQGFSGRESIQVDANNFLGGTEQAALKYGEHAADEVNRAVQHHYVQQLDEADKTLSRDAIQQYRTSHQDAMYGKNGPSGTPRQSGFLELHGKDAFAPTDGKSPASKLTDDLSSLRSGINSTLNNDRQRALFADAADTQDFHTNGLMQQHEGQQTRVYQESTLLADNASHIRNIELNNNNPQLTQQSYDALKSNHAQLASMYGKDPRFGEEMARTDLSKALKVANDSAMQQGDVNAVMANIEKFSPELDPQTDTAIKREAFSGWAAGQIQNNPQALFNATKGDPIKAAILKTEGGADNFDANGQPAVSSDGKSIGTHQVTDSTANAPGFGIEPAKARTHAEYNRIGDQLITKHSERYQGDPEKVAAAYNAGAGAVDKAIAEGGDNWKDHLPASTRDTYLSRFRDNLKTNTPLDYASPEQRLQANRSANAMIEKSRSVASSALENDIKNQYSQTADKGVTGDLIPQQRFMDVLGADKGSAEYTNYVDNINHNMDYFSIKDMPVADAQKLLSDQAPKVGEDSPDYAREKDQYKRISDLYQHAQEQRMKDPMAAATKMGFPVKQINWGQPQQAAAEIVSRMSVSDQMSAKYGTPATLLSDSEAKGLTETFDKMPTKDALQLMNSLKTHSDPVSYGMTMQQLRKDSPVTAIAGALYGIDESYTSKHWYGDNTYKFNGQKAAETILKGERILNQTKGDKSEDGHKSGLFIPKEEDFRGAFDSSTNGAFSGKPITANNTYQAVKAAYVSLSSESGDTNKEFNGDRFKQAIGMVTGTEKGALEVFGNRVIPPYGMPEDIFKDKVTQEFNRQSGPIGTDKYIGNIRDYKIIPLDDGVYGFTDGSSMKPIVINLNNRPDAVAAQINP